MRTISVVLLVLGLGLLTPGCKKRANTTDGGDKDSQGGTNTPAKPGTFTVGKSTTVVTSPVDSTGHIDYPAALNERLSKGVTAENNANVAIWKVLGPNPAGGGGRVPTGYFEKMGTTAPPATGDYFVGLKQYAEQKGVNVAAAQDAMRRYADQPWTTNQDATLSGWLLANHKPLTALREAVKKTQYYNPLIPETDANGSKGLTTSLLPGPQACRDIAGAFAARAMLFLGHNQTAEAWQDLLACHRLGRLVGRGGATIEALVGVAIEQIACRGDVAYLERGQPDANTILACLKDLRALPALPSVADKVDGAERFTYLENLMLLDRLGYAHVARSLEDPRIAPENMVNQTLKGLDWNPALENANKVYDDMVAALRDTDRASRNKKLAEIGSTLSKYREQVFNGWASLTLSHVDSPATKRAQLIGEMYLALLMPDARKVQDAVDRTIQTHENVIVAFAVVWYQRVNGRYPAKLAELAPTYLTQVPQDLFTAADLIYKPAANGFVLYSVGLNGRDDGGRGYNSNPPGDDLVVRIPQVAKP